MEIGLVTGDAAAAHFADVSRETRERLDIYHAALLKWQKAINLVAPSTLAEAWTRHFVDSLSVFRATDNRAGHWLDIGSGGGFPGLVCAVLAAEARPDLRFTLVDSDLRKATFLRNVAREMGLSTTVHAARVDALPPQDADVISARALAALPALCAMAQPHLVQAGICLFQKGARWQSELASARGDWQMEVEVLPSLIAADSVVLKIGNLSHA